MRMQNYQVLERIKSTQSSNQSKTTIHGKKWENLPTMWKKISLILKELKLDLSGKVIKIAPVTFRDVKITSNF